MPRVSPQFPQHCPFLLAPLSSGATEGKPHAGIHRLCWKTEIGSTPFRKHRSFCMASLQPFFCPLLAWIMLCSLYQYVALQQFIYLLHTYIGALQQNASK